MSEEVRGWKKPETIYDTNPNPSIFELAEDCNKRISNWLSNAGRIDDDWTNVQQNLREIMRRTKEEEEKVTYWRYLDSETHRFRVTKNKAETLDFDGGWVLMSTPPEWFTSEANTVCVQCNADGTLPVKE